jgi:hypothetical protein
MKEKLRNALVTLAEAGCAVALVVVLLGIAVALVWHRDAFAEGFREGQQFRRSIQ